MLRMGKMKNEFFNEQAEQSLVKSTIVKKYFWVWANVILSAMKKKANQKNCIYKFVCRTG